MDYVLPDAARAPSRRRASSHVAGEPENIAYLTLFFDDRLIAHVHVNWLAPVKVRRTLIGGSSKMIVYDDLEPSEKIKVYDKGVTARRAAATPRQVPDAGRLPHRRHVGAAARHDRGAAGSKPSISSSASNQSQRRSTDGEAGLRVVRILEAATQSMASRGRVVELDLRQ